MQSHEARLRAAEIALEGLHVGDCFGETYFVNEAEPGDGALLPGPWPYTDDSALARAVFECLAAHRGIDRDALAAGFAETYAAEPRRGYGGTAHEVLRRLGRGEPWRAVSGSVFGGSGSYGNGGAMRVAPIGAYYADDPEACADAARASAEVTHAHVEGQVGAIAVALAVGVNLAAGPDAAPADLLEAVAGRLPGSEIRAGVERAARLPSSATPTLAAQALGCGYRISAQDTVPFCLWAAFTRRDDYAVALVDTVSVGGDRDTTCAIVGGILAPRLGEAAIPAAWRERAEPLLSEG